MITQTQELKNNLKIDKSYINYNNIINKKLSYKFSYLDDWLLKKSKLLLREAETLQRIELQREKKLIPTPKNYKKYERGTIIKVDFGVSLGSEMSQIHFAIVLNNYDNYKNNVLTVVPLTSTDSKFNLNLKSLIHNLIEEIQEQLKYCKDDPVKEKKLHNVLDYYKTNKNNTYACCSLITTISKTRILSPINEYDIIGRKKCSKDILDLIDNDIKDKFTTKCLDII